MTWTHLQRLALVAFIAVEVLIFMGAIVRATGSGLGCPDWPFCYGCWLPPTKANDIDFDKIDLDKFRAKAARLGRDPASITTETLRAGFDPVATWVEYLNRLTSLPVGLSALILLVASVVTRPMTSRQIIVAAVLAFIAGLINVWLGVATVLVVTIASVFALPKRIPAISVASIASFLLVLINAWLGARVVLSGLKPGIITLHMALAILLQCVLVFAAWRGTDRPWRLPLAADLVSPARRLVIAIFLLVILEGILGSQVRELTDLLAREHARQPRAAWTAELERSTVYLVHRSFSWLILGAGLWFAVVIWKWLGRLRWLEAVIIGLIFLQMLLGIILSQVGIVRLAQILHIGASSLLVSALILWLLAARRAAPSGGSGATPAIS